MEEILKLLCTVQLCYSYIKSAGHTRVVIENEISKYRKINFPNLLFGEQRHSYNN